MRLVQTPSEFDAAALSQARVVVLGDALLDCYDFGDVHRVSPEAPVPVLRYQRRQAVAGGAANVAVNAATLGAKTTLIAVVGADDAADELKAILAPHLVSFEAVIDGERPTSIKTRVVANNQQLIRIDRESTRPIDPDTETKVISRLQDALAECDVLLISDYGKGCLTDRVLAEAISLCGELGIPSLVDPKRADFSAYAGASLIKPNLAELQMVCGYPCETSEAITDAAQKLQDRLSSSILVTRSSKGMSLFEVGKPALHVPAKAQEVFDVSGAGDTVLATLGVALATQSDLPSAVRLANAAAGVVVRKAGTASVTAIELRDALAADTTIRRGNHAHIADWHSAKAVREDWKHDGLKVGFTNGCFDLLHPGHIRIIAGAAAHCDRLILGLNSDKSIARLKGPSRPIQPEADRAEVLAALSDVDMVVLFDQDTPLELVDLLVPDVIAKGADYTEDQVVGADVVKAAGGRVVLVPLLAGRSTTSLIERSTR